MCAKDCGACPNCRETDVWIVSSLPASTETARPATQARAERDQAPTDPPTPEHASTGLPALTVTAFEAALRRDGGAR